MQRRCEVNYEVATIRNPWSACSGSGRVRICVRCNTGCAGNPELRGGASRVRHPDAERQLSWFCRIQDRPTAEDRKRRSSSWANPPQTGMPAGWLMWEITGLNPFIGGVAESGLKVRKGRASHESAASLQGGPSALPGKQQKCDVSGSISLLCEVRGHDTTPLPSAFDLAGWDQAALRGHNRKPLAPPEDIYLLAVALPCCFFHATRPSHHCGHICLIRCATFSPASSV